MKHVESPQETNTCSVARKLLEKSLRDDPDTQREDFLREHLLDCDQCFHALSDAIEQKIDCGEIPLLECPPDIAQLFDDEKEKREIVYSNHRSDVWDMWENAELFSALVERSCDATFLLDSKTTCVYANQTAADLLDAATPRVIIGKSFADFVAPGYEQVIIDSQLTGVVQLGLQGLHGQVRQWKGVKEVVPYKEQQAVRICIPESSISRENYSRECLPKIVEEIYGERQTEKRMPTEEITQEVLERLNYAMIAFTEDGQLSYVNHVAANMVGETPHDMVGQSVRRFFAPSSANLMSEHLRQAQQDAEVSNRPYKLELNHKERRKVWVEAQSWSPLQKEKHTSEFQTIYRDITKQEIYGRLIEALPGFWNTEGPKREEKFQYHVLEHVQKLLDAETVCFLLAKEEEAVLVGNCFEAGKTSLPLKPIQVPQLEAFPRGINALATEQIVLSAHSNPVSNQLIRKLTERKEDYWSLVPLKDGNNVVGVICAGRQPSKSLTEDECRFFQWFGSAVSPYVTLLRNGGHACPPTDQSSGSKKRTLVALSPINTHLPFIDRVWNCNLGQWWSRSKLGKVSSYDRT